MTMTPYGGQVDSFLGIDGMEDIEPTDLTLPILKVDHIKGVFTNTLSGETWEKIPSIVLGVTKQRVLWPPELPDEGAKERPMCRSYNFKEGHPHQEKFPWEKSGFDSSNTRLPCLSCPLNQWDSHPTKASPWCSEQHVYSLLQIRDDGSYQPLILTVQRSGLKGSKDYISACATAKQPFYMNYTELGLEHHKRGSNPYCTVKFTRGTPTVPGEHPDFSNMGRQIRLFLQTPFQEQSETDPDAELLDEAVDTVTPETQASPGAPSTVPTNPLASAATPAQPSTTPEDDLPF